MADILIQHLQYRGSEHSALSMLVNQWGFDEKLIPKALQTIGSLFPHYSRHDESHSKQILINIERLLGDNINLLTATDTWLLLEAAYWHDIGMVVPQQDIEDALVQPAFRQYVDTIRNAPHHELNRFTKSFNPQNLSKCFSGADTPMEAVDKFRQLMAEWFRRQHAGRSESIIQAPWSSAGINSPRTELIPARLFKLLGRICEMHGRPFAELLSGLPFKEAGLAQEDCHPRFVACLLRMGDLLDLDDNRFCPVMQRIAGANRSHISKAHEDKHAGIRHLRIDRERIEISAECETIDGYLETFKWFDWLKQEIQDQMTNWQDIAPNRALGLLPTLGNISVRLSGELRLLKEGQRPQFSVDGPKAIELLQGHNLYSTKFACVRELLQNAIDATLLRLWLTEQEKKSSADWANPFSSGAIEVLQSANVTVALTEMPNTASDISEKSVWILTITDQGTGISREDLEYMLRIGGSQRNTQRQNNINAMPEWMKPSGAFGIGFQSAFLICDEVTLKTKSIFTNETLQVTMHSPTGNKEGLVLLKQLENDISRPYGTTIEIKLQLDTFAKSWTISFDNMNSIAAQFVNSMDPVLDSSFPYDAAKLADQIRIFAAQSPLEIKAKLVTSKKAFDVTADVTRIGIGAGAVTDRWRFVKTDDGDELAIIYRPTGPYYHPHNQLKTFYRGQPFEYKNGHFPHVHVAVNLMSGKAGAWLTANRDNLAPSAEDALDAMILSALEQLVRQDIQNASSCELLTDEHRPSYSFFLEAMATRYGGVWIELAKEVSEGWLDLPSPTPAMKFRDYFEKDQWIFGESVSSGEETAKGCEFLVSPYSWASSTLPIILNEWQKKDNQTVQVLGPEPVIDEHESQPAPSLTPEDLLGKHLLESTKFRVRYQLKKGPQPPYTEEALATRLAGAARESASNRRFILNPCDEEWSALYMKNETPLMAFPLFRVFRPHSRFILLPFLFRGLGGVNSSVECTPAQMEALCRWVQPHLLTSTALDDIREAYENLKDSIDNKIMRPSPHWELWKTMRRLS